MNSWRTVEWFLPRWERILITLISLGAYAKKSILYMNRSVGIFVCLQVYICMYVKCICMLPQALGFLNFFSPFGPAVLANYSLHIRY